MLRWRVTWPPATGVRRRSCSTGCIMTSRSTCGPSGALWQSCSLAKSSSLELTVSYFTTPFSHTHLNRSLVEAILKLQSSPTFSIGSSYILWCSNPFTKHELATFNNCCLVCCSLCEVLVLLLLSTLTLSSSFFTLLPLLWNIRHRPADQDTSDSGDSRWRFPCQDYQWHCESLAGQGRAGEGQGRGVAECIRQDGMEMKWGKELGIVWGKECA